MVSHTQLVNTGTSIILQICLQWVRRSSSLLCTLSSSTPRLCGVSNSACAFLLFLLLLSKGEGCRLRQQYHVSNIHKSCDLSALRLMSNHATHSTLSIGGSVSQASNHNLWTTLLYTCQTTPVSGKIPHEHLLQPLKICSVVTPNDAPSLAGRFRAD